MHTPASHAISPTHTRALWAYDGILAGDVMPHLAEAVELGGWSRCDLIFHRGWLLSWDAPVGAVDQSGRVCGMGMLALSRDHVISQQ
jgi:hypothetical protein